MTDLVIVVQDIYYDNGTGYPDMTGSGFEAIHALEDYNVRVGLQESFGRDILEACPSDTIVFKFFGLFILSLEGLSGKVQLEVVCGEVNQEMSKMRFSEDKSRPAHFPKLYTRAWLSNVP